MNDDVHKPTTVNKLCKHQDKMNREKYNRRGPRYNPLIARTVKNICVPSGRFSSELSCQGNP